MTQPDPSSPSSSLSTRVRELWPLVAVALGAWVLRSLAFLHRSGPLGYPMDYDEGVLFSAAALLLRGDMPYRDFIFVHPPGALLLWAPGAALSLVLDTATAYGVTRFLAAAVGALSVFLAGRVAWRAWGPLAGFVAALAYAAFPEAAISERGSFLEPLLNVLCLGFANLWLAPGPRSRGHRVGAGVLLGLAVSVKFPGALWLVAALASRPFKESWRSLFLPVLVALATFTAVAGPFAAFAPSEFVRDVFTFPLARPPEGELDRWLRLRDLFPERRLGESVLALVGLAAALARALRAPSEERSTSRFFAHAFLAPSEDRATSRFFACAFVLTVALLLTSRTYGTLDNAHLAASAAVLAGLGACVLQGFAARWGRTASRAMAGLALAAAFLPGAWNIVRTGQQQSPDVLALAQHLRAHVPSNACLFAFDPGHLVAAGRLPLGATPLVDPYATQLQDALLSGERFEEPSEALSSEDAQQTLRITLDACQFVVVGPRGARHLPREVLPWFKQRFVRRFPEDGGAVDLWEHKPR
jgi:hypothetical protein